jgi:hypothetical protein
MKETALRFESHGRTYDCVVEKAASRDARDGRGRTAMVGDGWWWFGVTGDRQRYAPFHDAKDDTAAIVQERIVTWYENLVAVRAMPSVRPVGGRRPGRPATVVAPVGTPSTLDDDTSAPDGAGQEEPA